MNILNIIKSRIKERICLLKEKKVIDINSDILNKVVVDYPNNSENGDIYTNAALVLSKYARKNPMELSKILENSFNSIEEIADVTVVKPGFINFKLKLEVWYNLLHEIKTLKVNYGSTNLVKGEKVNIEFASANPTGPLHIGHARGAIFSDVLANLLVKVGYKVTREYYINDAGEQINKLLQSVYLRYKEALGENVIIESGLYPGEYLKPVGKSLVVKYGSNLLSMEVKEREQIIREFSLEYMLNLIKSDLSILGIYHDVFTSEFKLQKSGIIEKCVELLSKKNLIYYGTLDEPKGGESKNWKPREQMLFKSTEFGDDVDRALQKEDGSWTYFAADIAYHFDKISRGFNYMILELGRDHGGYVKRLQAAVSAISNDEAKVNIKLHGIVNFLDNGQPVKMSKRQGNFLTVKDVIDEVGKDVTRFIMLTRQNDKVLDFDFVKVKEQSKDNPVFYVQYAHARACSLMRSVTKVLFAADVDLTVISSKEELFLIKVLSKWPSVVESSALSCEPHQISFYLMEVAEAFHKLWGYGNNNLNMRFIIENDIVTTSARLFLAEAVANVIAAGFAVFGITPLQEMR